MKKRYEFVPKGFSREKIAETQKGEFVAVDVGGEVAFDHHSANTEKCAAELVAEDLVFSDAIYGLNLPEVVVTHFSPDVDSVIATYLVAKSPIGVIGWQEPNPYTDFVNYDEILKDWREFGERKFFETLRQLKTCAHWTDFAEFEKLGKAGFAAVVSGLNLIHGRNNEAILREGHAILAAAIKAGANLADLSGLTEAQDALSRVQAEKAAVAKAKSEGRWFDLPNDDRALVVETTAGITMPEDGYGEEYQVVVFCNPETRALRVLCSPVVGERYRQIIKNLAVLLDETEKGLDPNRPLDREHNWFSHPGGQMLCSPSIEGKVSFSQFSELVLKELETL